MSISTLILILEAVGVLGAATFVFIVGHKLGRWSCRFDYPNGFDAGNVAGQKAERERWESAGTTWDALAAWNTARPPDPAEEWEAWDQNGEAPSTEVLLTAADERLGKPVIHKFEGQLSDAEADQWKARWEAAQRSHFRMPPPPEPGPPVVADLTGPDAWHYPGEDDVPTLTGLVVTRNPRDRTGPEWLDAQLAAMDSETDAYLRRQAAEVALFRRGITTGARP